MTGRAKKAVVATALTLFICIVLAITLEPYVLVTP